jgi:hypothetical protein
MVLGVDLDLILAFINVFVNCWLCEWCNLNELLGWLLKLKLNGG